MHEITEGGLFSGGTANVELLEKTAILTPKIDMPFRRDALKKNIYLLKLLKQFTKGLKGLKVPTILEEDERKCKYTVERAHGVNISEAGWDSQGDIRDFFAIPPEKKVDSVIAYLRMVGMVNKAGYAFNDHKVDSVFIEPNGELTIVDAGGMIKTDKPWQIDSGKKSGLSEIIEALFTRNIDSNLLETEPFTLVPAGIECVINNLHLTTDADDTADVIEAWRNGTLNLSTRFPYKMIEAKRVSNIDYQEDMAEAKKYLQEALKGNTMQDYFRFLDRKKVK